ncbi:MAG: phosphatidate cytidylyltransferase [Clostridiales bacterium]|nr:phosphatidate cytidylyltransferase [Clostridiales bacterium]
MKSSLKPRLLTAVIGIAFLILVIFLGELWTPVIYLFVGFASAFMVGEYLHVRNMLKIYSLSVPCMLFSFAMSFLILSSYLYLLIFAFVIVAFSVMILKHKVISFIDLAYSVTGTLLISFGMSAVSMLCSSEIGLPFYFVSIFALPWMADAGGFFIGGAVGRHRLCPNISPKKTVEGAVGGVAFCIAAAVLVWLVFQLLIYPDVTVSIWALILLGAVDALVSILGDLSFSLLKRSLNIKDYGSVFPGHGGMLDRFDSIIFTAPVMVVINQFLPFITLG